MRRRTQNIESFNDLIDIPKVSNLLVLKTISNHSLPANEKTEKGHKKDHVSDAKQSK